MSKLMLNNTESGIKNNVRWSSIPKVAASEVTYEISEKWAAPASLVILP